MAGLLCREFVPGRFCPESGPLYLTCSIIHRVRLWNNGMRFMSFYIFMEFNRFLVPFSHSFIVGCWYKPVILNLCDIRNPTWVLVHRKGAGVTVKEFPVWNWYRWCPASSLSCTLSDLQPTVSIAYRTVTDSTTFVRLSSAPSRLTYGSQFLSTVMQWFTLQGFVACCLLIQM